MQGGHSEDLEGARSDEEALEPLRAFARGVQHVLVGARDHAVEHVVLLGVVEQLGAYESATAAGLVALRVVDLHRHQPLRVGIGKRLHQHVVDDAEEGGGGRNAEGERDHGHRGEPPALGEGAKGVPEVLEDGRQVAFSAGIVGTLAQQ